MDANPYLPKPAQIIEIQPESDTGDLKTFSLRFTNKKDAETFTYLPGQFAELSILGVGEAPFGMASSPTEGDILKFTILRAGSVTKAIHRLSPNDVIGIRGPYGNPFPLDAFRGQSLVLIGGGFGITTLRSLLIHAIHPEHRHHYDKLTVIYGARTPGLFIFRSEFESLNRRDDIDMHMTIDTSHDSWSGHVGLVPEIVQAVSPSPENSWALLCGPPIMIRYTLPVLETLGFDKTRILCSLERKMKCGIGLCGRCNIGHLYVCKDGPIFSVAELELLPQET